jgi:hypothetical protein
LKQIQSLPGYVIERMNRFLKRANLNSAFKQAQPLPMLRANPPDLKSSDTPGDRPEGPALRACQGVVAPQLAGLFQPGMHEFTSTGYASVLRRSPFWR